MIFINSYGNLIKKIRKSRKLSQDVLTEKQLSRSLIAKIENEEVVPTIAKFQIILRQLGISFDEFFFISDNYKASELERIKQKLYLTFHNSNTMVLNNLVKECDELYLKDMNSLVLELKNVILAMLEVLNDNFEEAKKLVMPVWKRLSNAKIWCISDIQMINLVLFVFSVDEAVEVVEKALNCLAQYDSFLVNKRTELSLRGNLVCLMMIENKITPLTFEFLEIVIKESHESRLYDLYAVALFRKGICKMMTGEQTSADIEQATVILNSINEPQMLRSLIKEKELYVKKTNNNAFLIYGSN